MQRVYAKHLPYTNGHYGLVFATMEITGEPTIRVAEFGGMWCALEGSHRLASSHKQGKIPKLVVLPDDDSLVPDDHWRKVIETLPYYDFPHIDLLDLRAVANKHGL